LSALAVTDMVFAGEGGVMKRAVLQRCTAGLRPTYR
jgi:hypothetical protein